ncbi:MAG: transcription antitermination factor NusB [Clostridia bacterium]|nr:transcription antitermination factor NusB [Deltaproteobacteria bacterium]
MRRRARESALQIVYQLDVAKVLELRSPDAIDTAIGDFWQSFEPVSPDDREFAERLVRGLIGDVPGIDAEIDKVSHNWRLDRMAKVDRSLLRLAAYEILRCPDIPRTASINEAIEIAKRFSGNESAAFINGILDQLGKAKA